MKSICHIYKGDIEEMLNLSGKNTIQFTNPMIAIIDTYNGSGDNEEFSGHTFKVELKPDNLFLDKTIKYSYTYSVCGMSSDWCGCTRVNYLVSDNPVLVIPSTVNREIEVENMYKKAYTAGGCTYGDMDVNRHRIKLYINDFPCGLHCTACGTF